MPKKSNFTVAENIAIADAWMKVESYMIANDKFLRDESGQLKPNPLRDAAYIAGADALTRLQGK